VWQDRRTSDRCRELRECGAETLLRERTGLVADPYFSATKLERLLRDPDIRRRAERGELAAGTVERWLVARLTDGSVHVTDHSNASRTLLYSLAARDWDPELLALFGVPRGLLPDIVSSSGTVGDRPGYLGISLPIAGLAGISGSAVLSRRSREGHQRNTHGTGVPAGVHRGNPPVAAARRFGPAACGPRGEPAYALEGACSSPGWRCRLCDGLRSPRGRGGSRTLRACPYGRVHFVPRSWDGTPHWEAGRERSPAHARHDARTWCGRARVMAFSSAGCSAWRDRAICRCRRSGWRRVGQRLADAFQADVLVFRSSGLFSSDHRARRRRPAGLALGVWRRPATSRGRRFQRFDPTDESDGDRPARVERAVGAFAWAKG
jgi:glycerol kinase